MDFPRPRRRSIGIDMSPLIDCVFQLLIFFMLSSSLLTPMIQLQLPRAETRDAPNEDTIYVTVDAEGRMYVNSKPIMPEQLKAELQALLPRSPKKVVTFRGDEKMAYQQFIYVLDTARACGAVNVHIAHRPQ